MIRISVMLKKSKLTGLFHFQRSPWHRLSAELRDIMWNTFGYPVLDVFSIVEDFELSHIQKYPKSGDTINDVTEINVTPDLTTLESYAKGRYKVKIDLDNSDQALSLGINRWNQYSTPDRTMMTSKVLRTAASDLAESLKLGNHVYIHGKSGISRSASTLATARAMLLIDGALAKGLRPSKQNIDDLIKEQINLINKSRPEVKIHGPQRSNIESVLFDYTANRSLGLP
ncbi:MAG: hypothetical protein AB8G05_04905 [Oligoflexales bacterium]